MRFCFEEGLETPMKAIPFYLLLGMAMGPALQPTEAWNRIAARSRLHSGQARIRKPMIRRRAGDTGNPVR